MLIALLDEVAQAQEATAEDIARMERRRKSDRIAVWGCVGAAALGGLLLVDGLLPLSVSGLETHEDAQAARWYGGGLLVVGVAGAVYERRRVRAATEAIDAARSAVAEQ